MLKHKKNIAAACVFNGISCYVVKYLVSTAPSRRGAEVLKTLVASGPHVFDCKLLFFVLDINRALSPQTKEFIDDQEAAVQPKGHARFSKFLLRVGSFSGLYYLSSRYMFKLFMMLLMKMIGFGKVKL